MLCRVCKAAGVADLITSRDAEHEHTYAVACCGTSTRNGECCTLHTGSWVPAEHKPTPGLQAWCMHDANQHKFLLAVLCSMHFRTAAALHGMQLIS
jgi:hypothetical protein